MVFAGPDHMVVEYAHILVKDHSVDEIDILVRCVVDLLLNMRRDVCVRVFLLDRFALHAELAINIVHCPERPLLEGDEILRHRRKPNRRHFVPGHDHHHGRADAKIKQELANRQIEISLPQRLKHSLRVCVQNLGRLFKLVLRDRTSRLEPAPFLVRREQSGLDPVGKALRRVNRGRIKNPDHLVLARNAAFVKAAVKIALRERELVAILVDRSPFILAGLGFCLPLHDLFDVKFCHVLSRLLCAWMLPRSC